MREIKWVTLTGNDLRQHVVPFIPLDGVFKSEAEAEAYAAKLEAADDPCVTDDDNVVIGAYFGHKPSLHCACCPERRETNGTTVIVHRVIQ